MDYQLILFIYTVLYS